MKVTLIHAPKVIRRGGRPVAREIMALPAGLLPLAALLRDAGHQVTVLHLGLEEELQPDFNLGESIHAEAPDLVGLSLQWHAQLRDGLAAAAEVKAAAPHTPVVAGGLTASHFSAALLRPGSPLDFVIRGDGELPMVRLLESLAAGGGDFSGVPNLSWRDAGEVRRSPLDYQISATELDALDISATDLLRHEERYSGHERADCTPDSVRAQLAFPVFHLPLGRGCTADCAFCGGGRRAHQALGGRTAPVMRSPETVAAAMERLSRRGRRFFFISFDLPGPGRRWHLELFRLVRRRGLKVGAFLELYHQPPDADFIDAFARTFLPRVSVLALSPHTCSASTRQRHGGPPYSREQLDEAVAAALDRDLRVVCYFTVFPDSGWDEVWRTASWAKALAGDGCRVEGLPVELEPRSPWSLDPARYGLDAATRDLDDYLRRHAAEEHRLPLADRLGYDAADLEARALLLRSATEDAETALGQSRGADHPAEAPVVRCAPPQLELAAGLAGPGAVYLVEGCEGLDARRHALQRLCRLGAAAGSVFWLGGPAEGPVDTCRWSTRPCPAGELKRLLIDDGGQIRLCQCWPPHEHGRAPSRGELLANVEARLVESRRQRGCADCPALERCSRCLYPGLSVDEFCDQVRRRAQNRT